MKRNQQMKKSRTVIKEASDKQQERNLKYGELKRDYLSKHQTCEVCRDLPSCSLHHRSRRNGLNIFRLFMATCMICHRRVENDLKQARAKGYIVDAPANEEIDEEDYPVTGVWNFNDD